MARRHAIHGAYSEVIVLSNIKPLSASNDILYGAHRPVAGSNQLAGGQIALTWDKPTKQGLEVVATEFNADTRSRFLNDKSDRRFYIEVGTGVNSNSGGMSSKNIRSVGFRPEDVLEVKYSTSKPAVQAEVILGYDGFDTSKGMTLKPGEAATVSLRLEGMPLAFYGRKDGRFEGTFSLQMPESDDCNDNCLDGACYDVVNNTIDEILNYQMVEGIPLSTFIDAYPVTDCFEDAPFKRVAGIWQLSVCDNGDDKDLGVILGALQHYALGWEGEIVSLVRSSRNVETSTSTYEIVAQGGKFKDAAEDEKPLNFKGAQPAINVLDCGTENACDEAKGRWYPSMFWYDFSVEDASNNYDEEVLCGRGGPIQSAFQDAVNIYNAEQNAQGNPDTLIVVEWGEDLGQIYGIQKCGLGLANEKPSGEIEAIQMPQSVFNRFVDYVHENSEGLHIKWEEGVRFDSLCVGEPFEYEAPFVSTCQIGEKLFYIDLKDDECGNSRLSDLQADYPHLTITEQLEGEVLGLSFDQPDCSPGYPTDGVYVTEADGGPLGPVEVTIVVSNNIVESITPTLGTSGFSVGDVITIDGGELGECNEIEATVTLTGIGARNCRRRYQTLVESEIKCPDPCYHEHYKFEAPGEELSAHPSTATSTFEFTRWREHVVINTDTTCNCGIAFKAKDLELCPPKEIADQIGTINKQIKIQVSGGELLGTKIGYPYNLKPFEVTYVTRAFDGTGWGEDYADAEKQTYDRYLSYLAGDNYAQRWFKNTTTKLDPCVQYDTFQVKLRSSKHSQGFSQRKEETFRYIFVVPKGTYRTFDSFFHFLTAGNEAANSLPNI